ncbi:hypothetical protein KL906_001646 [Ogataea polymorpha]|nr:hypothetical protein KL906_001646 [Ogataea polymorpha]
MHYPDTSFHHGLPETIKPVSYDVRISNIDVAKKTFHGLCKIDFHAQDTVKSVILNQKMLQIGKATASSSHKAISLSETVANNKDETVEFKFAEPLKPGPLSLSIEYTGPIRTDMGGFYDSSYKEGDQLHTLLCTQFESTDARSAFPCSDEPAFKATFRLSLTIENQYDALSNMPVDKIEPHGKTKTVTFLPSPKMSTYLVAWCIGKFEYVESNLNGLPIRVYTVPGQSQNGKYALSVAEKAVDYLSKVFDIAYPLPKLHLIAVPAFGANAMENWGLVLFRATALLFDPEKSDLAYKSKVAYVVSHEIAHSWFGNYCTMNWWSDLWLNESFATYIGWLCVDNMHPEWDVFTDFVSSSVQAALDLDSLTSSHPVEVQVLNGRDIDQIFDYISYLKGGSVVRMVAESVGVDLFLSAVSKYLKEHSYGNARSDDLWDAVSATTGKDITKLVAPWIRAVGFPYLHAKIAGDQVKIAQQRFLLAGKSDDTTWWIPELNMTEKSKTIPLEQFTKLNKSTTGFYRVVYDPALFDHVLVDLNARDKIGLVADTFAAAQAGLSSTKTCLELVERFKDEEEYAVWAEIAKRLGALKRVYFGTAKLDTLVKFSKQVYEPVLKKLMEKKELKFQESKLRSLVFEQCGLSQSSLALKYARSTSDPSLRRAKLTTLLASRECSREELLQVIEEVKNPSSVDAREIALCALGSVNNKAYLDDIFALFFTESLPEMDYIFLCGSLSSNPVAQEPFWNFFKANFDRFHKETSIWTLDRVLRNFLPNFGSETLYADAKSFFAGKDLTGFDKGVRQSLEAIEVNMQWARKSDL